MSVDSISYLNTRIATLENTVVALTARINALEHQLPKYATHGQLKTSEANTKNIINQNSIVINDIQQQLQTISIPSDTKYYLSNTEIEDFRTNYQRLLAMMTDADNMYKALIAYTVQNTTP